MAIRSSMSVPVAPTSPACSRSSTLQLQMVPCHGAHNQHRPTRGQRLKLLSPLRHQVLGRLRQPIRTLLKTRPSRCVGASIILKLPLLHILNLPSPQDIHLRRVLPSMNRSPPLHPLQISHLLGRVRGTDQQSQVRGHRHPTQLPVNFVAGLQVIVPYKMDPFQPFPPILTTRTHQVQASVRQRKEVRARAER